MKIRCKALVWPYVLLLFVVAAPAAFAAGFSGTVSSAADGSPVVGTMVTFRYGEPFQERTVFTDAAGRYRVHGLPGSEAIKVRVRRIGWRDLRSDAGVPAENENTLHFALERETDPERLAAQLPANHWYALVLEKLDQEHEREQLVRQCTYCHQQGNLATRVARSAEEWRKVLALMARMGASLDSDLAARVPELFNSAYDPAHAIPRLTAGSGTPDFAPPPPPSVRQAVIDEFELGGRSSMQHDMIIHPNGYAYSVDMTTDHLFRLDPSVPGGRRESYRIPTGDMELGGEMGSGAVPPNAEMRVGPHSLQVGKNGDIWITLAVGNQLARFDIREKRFEIEDLPAGIYPHTLRVDDRGRIWYTIAISNHVGMYDPDTGQHEVIRVPARSFGEEVLLRMLPAILWVAQALDLEPASSGEGASLPVPYGIDFAPDGGVWFSQLNAHRIGRIDPESFALEMVDTPFTAPRRMRFDSRGQLWIPGFSSNLVARFDPQTREFEQIELPIEPLGSETPYALNIDPTNDDVWICGTNSDTLIRYRQDAGEFTVYPLPTQVSYTREIDFDADGAVWTSNSNAPAWQIETGVPRLIRLDVDGNAAAPLASAGH